MALELARSGADIGVVVGFHCGLATQRRALAGEVTAGILVCIGADDPMVPAEQRAAFEEEMREAGVDWRINIYGGASRTASPIPTPRYQGSPEWLTTSAPTSGLGEPCSTSSRSDSDRPDSIAVQRPGSGHIVPALTPSFLMSPACRLIEEDTIRRRVHRRSPRRCKSDAP